jgi:hypothetical protein
MTRNFIEFRRCEMAGFSLQVPTAQPKALPAGGPNTNSVFEELRQHPKSEYSISMVYTLAMMASHELPIRGDVVLFDHLEQHWIIERRNRTSVRSLFLQLVQVTNGGSLQFRFLDAITGEGWRSVFLPTEPLFKTTNRRRPR